MQTGGNDRSSAVCNVAAVIACQAKRAANSHTYGWRLDSRWMGMGPQIDLPQSSCILACTHGARRTFELPSTNTYPHITRTTRHAS